tara:strand:- start:1038 stop:1511 length:474 start_codon:yes stop_codon:yes gene_type:complete
MEAVEPLLPHLPEGFKFAEPCAGNGALIEHLETKGVCMWASDIEPQAEGIHASSYDTLGFDELIESDYIVTNPPWDRMILHPMIEFFAPKRSTWLLFDADWMHTKQSRRYMPWCRKIVSVGRIKWFGNMTGKDNCAWYLFKEQWAWDAKPPEFIGRI